MVRVTVFGATGRTGRLLVREARSRGFDITVYARDRGRVDDPDGLRVVEGPVDDAGRIGPAVEGADAVFSGLGPIAGVTSTEISTATQAIVTAMQDHGVRRFVLIANDTIFSDDEVTGAFANVSAEHRRDLAIVRASSLDWTIMAPKLLRDDQDPGQVTVTLDGAAPGRSISRTDLARVMVDALDRPAWIGHALGVAG